MRQTRDKLKSNEGRKKKKEKKEKEKEKEKEKKRRKKNEKKETISFTSVKMSKEVRSEGRSLKRPNFHYINYFRMGSEVK
jgi:FKBP-type peptidyl-prolyl cis-trans isomerase